MAATCISRSVTPFITSTTNNITSASSTAISTCLRISSSKISSEFTTHPPVSTTENSFPNHSDLPYWRSRVVPASSFTIAWRVLVKRLNKVDFPTLGRPTIATKFPIVHSSCFCDYHSRMNTLIQLITKIAQLFIRTTPILIHLHKCLQENCFSEEPL